MPTLPLADINLYPLIPIIAIIGGMLIAVLIPIFAWYFQHRKQQLWHETARVAMEKGQPLPSMPDEVHQPRQQAHGSNDLRSGLILISVGAGLYLFLGTMAGRGLGLVGAIPGFIGVALLLYALLNAIFKRKDTPPVDRS